MLLTNTKTVKNKRTPYGYFHSQKLRLPSLQRLIFLNTTDSKKRLLQNLLIIIHFQEIKSISNWHKGGSAKNRHAPKRNSPNDFMSRPSEQNTIQMVVFLFNTVIYVFLLLCLCILIVRLCMVTLSEVFPCFFLSCKANARVKPTKTGLGPHSS
jgi:hypothetical protein